MTHYAVPSLLLLTNKVRIASRLRILPEPRLKVVHDVVCVPQRVASVQLATPPLLRRARLIRDERDGLGDAGLLSDSDVLGVNLSSAGAVPVVVRVLLGLGGSRSLNRIGLVEVRGVVGELRLLDVLSGLLSRS